MRYVLDLDDRHEMALRRFVRDRRGGVVPADDLSELSSGDDRRERPARQPSFLRRHRTIILLVCLGLVALVLFTWANWHNYVMRQQHDHVSAVFFSWDYLAEWLYNAASNWQSEILFGGAVVLWATRHAPRDDEEADS